MGDSSRALLCSFEMIKDEEEDLDEYSDEEGSPAVIEEAFDLGRNDSLTESIVQASQKVGPEHFHPICLLGQGSFGEVYLVQKKDTKVYYAMKVL